MAHLSSQPLWTSCSRTHHGAVSGKARPPSQQHHPPTLFPTLSPQFDSEFQFNNSVKVLLSRLPKQRYLKSICDELHRFKIAKK